MSDAVFACQELDFCKLVATPLGRLFFVTNLFQRRQYETPLLEDSITPWMGPLAPWARGEVHAYNDDRARNWFAICCVVSMLVHIAFFVIPWPKEQLDMTPPPAASARGPVSVHLETRRSHATPDQDKEVHPKPQPEPPQPAVVTTRHPPSRDRPTVPPPPPIPEPTVKPSPQPPPPDDDFSSRLAKRRAERGEEDPSPNAQETSGGGGNSDNSVALNNINRAMNMNSRTVGTGGIFQVIGPIGVREATLQFNGWHPGSSNHWRETYTVDAGEGGDVKLAVVRKEIEIIRKFYKGDFDWVSDRHGGRVIKMSARPEDNDQLERFLMQEMWSSDDDGVHRRG